MVAADQADELALRQPRTGLRTDVFVHLHASFVHAADFAADRIVGKAAAFLYVLLGVRTVYAPLMSVPARETLHAHGIEAIADTVVPAIRNRTDTGFCPMESAVWDISDPCEAKAALERTISEMMAKK